MTSSSQANKPAIRNSRRQARAKRIPSISPVMNDKSTRGGRKEGKWRGGGGSESSKKTELSAAIASTARFLAGTRNSHATLMDEREERVPAAEMNSEDEIEQELKRKKQEMEVMKRVMGSVVDYAEGEIKLNECDEIFDITTSEKYSKPSLQTVFKCYMEAAVKKACTPGLLAKFGDVLAFCLWKKSVEKNVNGREDILKGVADFFRVVVEIERWDELPRIWDFAAEVLINALLPEGFILVGAHTTLVDFKDSFLIANNFDTRTPYAFFVLVLKGLAEKYYSRYDLTYKEEMSWVLHDLETMLKHMNKEKLVMVLKAMRTDYGENLYGILQKYL